jgi:hypothetical protein
MRNFNIAPIILLIIFILIPLANYVLERMRRRFEPPAPGRQPMPGMGTRRQPAPVTAPAFPALRERAQESPPNRILAPSRSRWSRKTLFRTRHDVRRVIVAMTVLGPCRAYDPPG